MNEEEIVRHCFESQRPMTEEEKYQYYQLQMERYRSKFVPMTPCINIRDVLERMIDKEKK